MMGCSCVRLVTWHAVAWRATRSWSLRSGLLCKAGCCGGSAGGAGVGPLCEVSHSLFLPLQLLPVRGERLIVVSNQSLVDADSIAKALDFTLVVVTPGGRLPL